MCSVAHEIRNVPHKVIGIMTSHCANLITVIIPSLGNLVFPNVVTGINQQLEGTHLRPVIGVTDYLPDKEENVLHEMLSLRPAGVIIAGVEHNEATKSMLQTAGIPVVEIMDSDGTPVDAMVGISHRRAGREMGKAILKAGYTRIGFLGTIMPLDHRARKRFEGFTEYLAKNGIEIEDRAFYSDGSSITKGREMTQEMLQRSPELEFLYFSNDLIAIGGLLHLLDQSIRIPEQIGLAGFNQIELLEGIRPRLATMDSLRLEIGRKAAEIINLRIKNPSAEIDKHVTFTPRIFYGDTLRRG